MRQVLEGLHARRVVRWHRDLEDVRREDLRLCALEAIGGQLLHILFVRRGEHIGRRAALDLGDQVRRPCKTELHLDTVVRGLELLADLLVTIGQGRGGEHGQRARLAPAVGLTISGTLVSTTGSSGHQQRRSHQRERALHYSPSTVSTTTFVDLIIATANDPSSRPRSRTASLDKSETTRNGPHCNSTCAITASAWMSMTSPTKRFRAELARPPGIGGSEACSRANWATAWPSTTLRPESSTWTVKVPRSIQRRTESSLTPR